MKDNKGITMVVLVITIIVLLIISGISIGNGNNVIQNSKLENLKTNMLLIKSKAKEYVEISNFNLGTNFENVSDEDKVERINNAKKELKGEEIISEDIFKGNIEITIENINEDKSKNIFYYKLSTNDLENMGLTNVKSDNKNGWYIIKYDVSKAEVEVYHTKGFEKEDKKYYKLNDIENLYL